MPFTDYFAARSETTCEAFERLMKKYEPKIFKIVRQYIFMYGDYLYSTSDRDDLLQIARFAFWEANESLISVKLTKRNIRNLCLSLLRYKP